MFSVHCKLCFIEIRNDDRCVSIILLVQVTLHFPCDVIIAGNLDDEASSFQVTLEQTVGHRGRFQGHGHNRYGYWSHSLVVKERPFSAEWEEIK